MGVGSGDLLCMQHNAPCAHCRNALCTLLPCYSSSSVHDAAMPPSLHDHPCTQARCLGSELAGGVLMSRDARSLLISIALYCRQPRGVGCTSYTHGDEQGDCQNGKMLLCSYSVHVAVTCCPQPHLTCVLSLAFHVCSEACCCSSLCCSVSFAPQPCNLL